MDYPGKVITKTQVTPTQTSASGNWTLDDQAAAIKNNNWPVALVPNPISKSLRFNSADSAYLNRTLTTPTNNKIWTWNAWIKRSALGSAQTLFSAQVDVNNWGYVGFLSGDTLTFQQADASSVDSTVTTTQVFRDVSAWYCLTVVFDSTQATSSNRLKMYLNGVQITAFSTATYLAQNTASRINTAISHQLGRYITAANYVNGYMTEINFIDGQALTPSDFGLTNPQTGQWIPKKYTGTYGTNGFYLNFKDATSTTTLGYDYSGNANNWTTNNFSVTAGSGNDSLTDVPTPWVAYSTTGDSGGVVRGNYCTWNPLDRSGASPTNGNLEIVNDSGTKRVTIPFPSSGKWYWEQLAGSNTNVGICDVTSPVSTQPFYSTTYAKAYYNNGTLYTGGAGSIGSWGATYTSGDIISGLFDATVSPPTLSFYKNNVLQGSAITLNSGVVYAIATGIGGAGVETLNCGQRPFAYTPPAGFRSLCTTNLPATTIGFGLTNQGNNYFDATLYTGNNSTPRSITGLNFQPDWVWIKDRSSAYNHTLWDAVRGVGSNKGLSSNSTDPEGLGVALGSTAANGYVSALNSNGFEVTSGSSTNVYVNTSPDNYVSWNWNAGGSNVTNTSGSITSTVRANTTSGFSIVTYTGTGANATVGHGLGVAPSMVITKGRDLVVGATNWKVYHASLGNTKNLNLNLTNAEATSSTVWNNTSPTSTVFSIGTNGDLNGSGATYVAYCFAAVPGYSAFGSYTGNGSADGPFVYTGFRPKFILGKRSDAANGWFMFDGVRNDFNVADDYLAANASAAEATFVYGDFLSNGFKLRATTGDWNGSGGTIIYAAFAESPFQFANAR